MNVLDLFSGIGGFSLGLERAGMRTVQFVECEPYARSVLRRHWPGVPLHDDIRTFRGEQGQADVICGGFPCTDISKAGTRAGIDGEASGLWAHYARLVLEVRPRYVIVENSAELLHRGLGRILGDMAALGYDAEWHCIPAAYAGAPIDGEGRDRCWIVAYPNDIGSQGPLLSREIAQQLLACASRGHQPDRRARGPVAGKDQSGIPRVADGVPYRSHRIACLGNAVYPPLVEAIGRAILATDKKQSRNTAAESGGDSTA